MHYRTFLSLTYNKNSFIYQKKLRIQYGMKSFLVNFKFEEALKKSSNCHDPHRKLNILAIQHSFAKLLFLLFKMDF